jgi:hypothetical protein
MGSFVVPSLEIVSEVIDGEAVILDLRSGRYYTADGVGAQVWRGVTAGMQRHQIVESCRAHFPGQPSADSDIDAFLELLVTAGLLLPAQESAALDSPVLDWPARYTPPALQWFDDLADMMALDPVHDVGVAGWPWPAPPTSSPPAS